MDAAFQSDAFQNDAFQVADAAASTGHRLGRIGLIVQEAPEEDEDVALVLALLAADPF